MANNYLHLAFAVQVTEPERDLILECAGVADAISELSPEERCALYAGQSDAFKAVFPEEGDDCYGSFCRLFDDQDYPTFGEVTIESEDGDDDTSFIVVYGDNADPSALGNLLQKTVASALPVGFEFAFTCSKPRLGEFGGGYVLVTKDKVDVITTATLMTTALEKDAS